MIEESKKAVERDETEVSRVLGVILRVMFEIKIRGLTKFY